MKKILLVLSVFSVSTIVSKAQSKEGNFTLGAGVQVALPTGNLHTTHSFGIGGQIQGEYGFSDNLTGIATTGYTSFFGKTVNDSYTDPNTGTTISGSYKYSSVGQIPILVGARFYPSEPIFVGAQIGVGIYSGGGSSSSGFEYRPQIGYDAGAIQVSLFYDGTSVSGGTLGYVGLSGVYKFGGGK